MLRSLRIVLLAASAETLLGVPASATLLVNLTTVELTPANRVHDITVQNGDDRPHILQASVVAWAQGDDGTITREPTTDLVVAPRVVELAPNGTQVVRVLARAPLTDSAEKSYRVELEEIAPRGSGRISVSVNSSYGIYVFTLAPNATRPDLSAALARVDAGHARLTFKNAGTMHALLGDVKIVAAGRTLYEGKPVPFILGASTRSALLPLAADADVGNATIQYEVNGHARVAKL